MTVSTTTGAVSYAGNGVTTMFDFTFPIPAGALSVYLTESDIALLVDPSFYTATGLGQDTGGSVAFGTAPANGKTVTIKRETPLTQDVALVTGAAFYAEVVESALDRLTMQVQDAVEGLGRAVAVPVGSGVNPADLIDSIEQSAASAQTAAGQAAGSATAAAGSATAASQDAALVAAALASLPRDAVVSISANRIVGADENGTLFAANSTANVLAVTAPESDDAATGNVDSPFTFWVQRSGSQAVTITPSTPDTIEGVTIPYSLADGFGAKFVLDETVTPHNWKAVPFGVSVSDATPVGAEIWFSGKTPPAGWMIENGALISRTVYPDLWAHAQASGMLTTEANWQSALGYRPMFSSGTDGTNFRLPDLVTGNLFVRAQGPAESDFGRRQEDELKSHPHDVLTRDGSGATAGGRPLGWASSGSSTGVANAGAATATGGAETRPRNAGRLPIIKVFNAVTNQAMVDVDNLINDALAIARHGDFVSADQAIVAGSLLTIPHGLGSQPARTQLDMVCVGSELGYAAGAVIQIMPLYAGANHGGQSWADATNLYVRTGSGGIAAMNTAGVIATASVANWRWRARAWR